MATTNSNRSSHLTISGGTSITTTDSNYSVRKALCRAQSARQNGEIGYAFMSPDTPVWARAVIIGAIGYFISPADAVPDLVPGVGYVDDAGVIASALAAVGSNITNEVEEKADKAVDDLLG